MLKDVVLLFSCVYMILYLRGCLVCVFKQPFSVFKQHFTHFNALFHPHVFSQIFSNNNFQFLNTCTKRKPKNFRNNILSMAAVSLNDHTCFNHYSITSCLYGKTTKERDNDKSVDPNFTPINNFNCVNQLRVLTVSNENFEVDLVPLYDEFMLSKKPN